jgi:hypothetical protein
MMNRNQVVTIGPETLEMCPEIHRNGLHKWVKIQLIHKMLTTSDNNTILNNWPQLDFINICYFMWLPEE